MSEIREIKIVDIIIDQNINTRPMDSATVARYREDMKEYGQSKWQRDWKGLPKITSGNHLWSGFHTIQAATEEFGNDHVVEVEIHGETHRDAFFLATGENATHGMPRSNEEKREAVKRWLMDDEMKLWSNSHIAKKCNVSPQFVINVSTSIVEVEEDYTRPTRLKQIDRYGNETWKDYGASTRNGNPEKPNRKELKRKHHSAMVNVQSAFFDADLHEHESFSHLPDVETGKKAQEFFRRTAFVRRRELRPDIFESMHTNSYLHETGKALTNAEIEAEIEVLKKIADQTRWYGKSEDAHLGWIESVLEMEPEPQETEDEEQVWERYKDAEKGMWQALWAKKAQVHAQNFITAACDAHLNWGVSNFPKNANAAEADGMLEIWTARFDLVTTEINIGSEWVTTFLESEHSDPGSDKVEPKTASEVADEADLNMGDRIERLRSDLFENHWQHVYSWEGLDILPFAEAYDIDVGIIERIQKEIAEDNPKPTETDEGSNRPESEVIEEARAQVTEIINGLDAPKPTNGATNGAESNYRLEYLTIGLRDTDGNPVPSLKFQLIASRQLDEHPLKEVPDTLKAELLKLVERLK